MLYRRLVEAYEEASETTKRTEMTDILVDLLKATPPDLIRQVVYLTEGRLYPEFVPVEMGMAEKLALKAVAEASGAPEQQVRDSLATTGDLGETARALLAKNGHPSESRLQVGEVYRRLDEMARASGQGSLGRKVELLAELLGWATPAEAKYLVRIVTGKLRLGLADMTILDALAVAYGGGKRARSELERAYNLCSDLGAVAEAVATGGLEAVGGFHIQPGKPVRPMLAQRMHDPREILEKLAGVCQAEYKYDGERLQIHRIDDRVAIFSRRLEDVTHQYPDAARFVLHGVKARQTILEAEAVAMNPETGELRPFQELMHRRRRYGIEKAIAQYPVVLYAFDLLYRDGHDLTHLPFPERRRTLMEVVTPSFNLKPIPGWVVDRVQDLEDLFHEAIAEGCEGLVCKSLKPDSVYDAGARGWNWIKYKREYVSAMTDTVDLVVVGALHGRGKRGGSYGALLLSAYDPETDSFPTVTKCGTGFSDEDLADLPRRLEPYRRDQPHPRVNARMKADVWFAPGLVIEVLGAEITLSPIHTADWGVLKPETGLAIRFPRFTGRYRPDKAPEDATTTGEILEMYQAQLKKVRR